MRLWSTAFGIGRAAGTEDRRLRELKLEPLMAEAIGKRIGWAFARLREAKWEGGEPGDYREILDAIEHTVNV